MQRTFVNTRYFREAALNYLKKGRYTDTPINSLEWFEFWREEERRCKEGYSVGGLSITGRHYWYLNYCPIQATKDSLVSGTKKGDTYAKMNIDNYKAQSTFKQKVTTFPRFWAIDFDWWWSKEIAMNGASANFVESLQIPGLIIKDYTVLKNQLALKTRRAGFSYKEGADGTYNFHFYPKSKSYYFASLEEYLIKDGILNKVEDILNHLNKNTDNWFRKNRVKKNTLLHQRASYLDGFGDERGYMSEIIGIPVDNPNKVRGKDGMKITFEEAGSFKNIKSAFGISNASLREGPVPTGQCSVFGTGGEEGPSIEGLTHMFENPDVYDMLSFYNIHEEGMEEDEVGMFIPCTATYEPFMDEDGNLDLQAALAFDDEERAKKLKSPDPKDIDRRKAEYPRTPSEALQRLTLNDFPVNEIKKQITRIRKSKDIQSSLMYGNFTNVSNIEENTDKDKYWNWDIRFTPLKDTDPQYIAKFPHKVSRGSTDSNIKDLTGASLILEPPERDEDGNVKPIYDVIVDPYAIEDAEDTTSLYISAVVKYNTPLNKSAGGRVVCIFAGRPSVMEDAHRVTAYQSVYYGCKIQSEIVGGGEVLKKNLTQWGMRELLHFEPFTLNNKEIAIEGKNRSIFMSMPPDKKRNGLTMLVSWLKRKIGVDEHGEPITPLYYINDIPTLQEFASYRPKKNFDRISIYILFMYMMREFEEKVYPEIMEQAMSSNNNNSFFNRQFYSGNGAPANHLEGTVPIGGYSDDSDTVDRYGFDNSEKTSRL